jgi:hypothetical protein
MENETIKEFDVKFEMFIKQIPNNLLPIKDHLLFLYIKAFPGHFGFIIRDNTPKTLEEAQEMTVRTKDNVSSYKVEPFYSPRDTTETKPRTLHNF